MGMNESNVVALGNQQSGSLMDMDTGAAGEMAIRLAEMKSKLNLVQEFFADVMVKGEDFGIIPGTDKPSLLKPGAEKLCELYGFASVVKEKKENRDFKTGYYLAELIMQIVHRKTGVVVAEGVGEASSYESKYRYRWVFESDLPRGLDKDSLVSKTFESKKNGKEYTRYRIENVDLIDQWNTVLKMAKKRALVDAVLSATRSSGIFSQSEDEMDAWIEGESGETPKEKYEKKNSTPQASDERSSFTPPTDNVITHSQYGLILGEAKRKGLNESQIKMIVQFTKKKSLENLSKSEASAVIDFLKKSTEDDLQDILLSAGMPEDVEI